MEGKNKNQENVTKEEKNVESKNKTVTLSTKSIGVIIFVFIIIIAVITVALTRKNENSNMDKSSVKAGVVDEKSNVKNGEKEEKSTVKNNSNGTSSTKEVKQVVLNDVLTVNDYCEIQIKSHRFANTIEPPTPTGYYNYYSARGNDYTYFDLQLDIKNLQNIAVRQNSLTSVKLIFDGKYEYSCFEVTEEADGGDFETFPNLYSIDPLKTLKYHFLTEVPVEVQNDTTKSLSVIIKSSGEEFEYKIR